MEMQNLEFEKRSTRIIKSNDFSVGSTFTGKLVGDREREITDRSTGELKIIKDLLFVDELGDTVAMPESAGLKVAMLDSRIQVGEICQIKRLEKTINQAGQPLNNYEILVAKKH